MKLPNFDEFVKEYSNSVFLNILDTIPKGGKVNSISDISDRLTEINMMMAVEYLRAYHEWMSDYLENVEILNTSDTAQTKTDQ